MDNAIVIYYTFEGNTGFAARLIAEEAGAAIEQLQVGKEPPKGFGKFLVGGGSALTQNDPALQPLQADPDAYENIILAFPIWAGTYPPAIGAFLSACPLKGKNIYLVASSASGKADKAFARVAERLPGCRINGTLSLLNPLRRQDETAEQIRAFIAGTEPEA